MWHNNFNAVLREPAMQDNALEILKISREFNVTINAVAGILANFEHETTINPGMFELGMMPPDWKNLWDTNPEEWKRRTGYSEYREPGGGLGGWTPYTKIALPLARYNDGDYQTRVVFRDASQWNTRNPMGWEWNDYLASEADPADLAEYFCKYWEIPKGADEIRKRRISAVKWYKFLLYHDFFIIARYNRHRYNLHTKRRL